MLREQIRIKDTYLKSARVDTDLSREFIEDIVFHGTAEQTLNTIFKSFKSKRRAFTVTGPYGSGKSTIALLLSALLGTDRNIREIASLKVGDETRKLLDENIVVGEGWVVVKFVGDFEDPLITVSSAVINEANRCGISLEASELPSSTRQLKRLLEDFSKKALGSYAGILLIFDEMGKSLDYLNSKRQDLQVFQELAEFVERSGESNDSVPMLLTGYMHQRFSGYANALSKMQKDDWAKVQGRFEDIAFNVTSLETIELLSNSIHHTDDLNISHVMDRSLTELEKQGINYLDSSKMHKCYPLHPVVALLLGEVSKRQFGQNERSVFNFLLSRERFGLREWLDKQREKSLYTVSDLFNYLETNFEHVIIGSSDGRAWASSEHALVEARKSNTDFEDGVAANIIKSVAMVNIFAKRIGIRADLDMIIALLANKENENVIRDTLDSLVANNQVVRRISGEYEIFHGSDINLDDEERKFIETNSDETSWKQHLSSNLSHVFAASVYHKRGSIRWMGKKIQFGSSLDGYAKPEFDQSYFSEFVVLMEGNAKEFASRFPYIAFTTISDSLSANIEHTAKRLSAIQHVELVNKALLQQHSSAPAREELEERKHLLKMTLSKQLDGLFNSATWHVKTKNKLLELDGELIQVASKIETEIFEKTPVIFNELINRATPSAAAVAARNKLMKAMVYESTRKELGIEGFPAEKGLYLSLLENTGLHRKGIDTDDWEFVQSQNNEHLKALWEETHQFLAEKRARASVYDLYSHWAQPPFGISIGLSPVLLLAFMLSNEGGLAFYDKDSSGKFMFITGPDEEFINKMIKRPKEVAIKSVLTDASEGNLISAISRALNDEGQQTDKESVLTLAKSIVRAVHLLSPYTKNTRNLSQSTLRFRELALKASDPHQFVTEDIPQLFSNPNTLEQSVSDALGELRSAHGEMLSRFEKQIYEVFREQSIEKLHQQALEISKFTTDPGLRTFSERLSEWTANHKSGEKISGFFSALSLKAERNWNDQAVEKARERLTMFASRFEQLTDIMLMSGRSNDNDLVSKDHTEVLQHLRASIGLMSRREQAVILQKYLDSIYKEDNRDE